MKLKDFAKAEVLPRSGDYLRTIQETVKLLSAEGPPQRRGGLVYLREDIPVLVLPDLHGRRNFLLRALGQSLPEGNSALELLFKNRLQIVCVGDGFHGEVRAFRRWLQAYDEYMGGYRRHAAMDREMTENLETMRMVMTLKMQFPGLFHFLKGNHENILNEEGDGNYPFGKFVNEGAMVSAFVQKTYGIEFARTYSRFEKALPLLARGRNFLISHAEPSRSFREEEIIGYRENPEIIYGLTWTGNDESAPGSVTKMLKSFFPGKRCEELFYLGGHRPVEGLYNLREEGKYIQFHNPMKQVCAYVPTEEKFEPQKHIYALPSGNEEEGD